VFIKKKSIIVIILSTMLISLVLIITLVGYYLYLNWQEENDRLTYCDSLYELNAKLFSKYVDVSYVNLKMDTEGVFKGNPVVEGRITNRSDKKLLSIKLRIAVKDKEDRVLYTESFYPLQKSTYVPILTEGTGQFLSPGDSISFSHILKNCPRQVVSYLDMRTQFAKGKNPKAMDLEHKVTELIIE